ncbi:MAG: DUF5652 family protein [Thermoleophilia bacterium]
MDQPLFEHAWMPVLLAVLVIWEIPWKGLALWRAARNDSKPWFILLLVVNTVGILEICYIFFFSRRRRESGLSRVFSGVASRG